MAPTGLRNLVDANTRIVVSSSAPGSSKRALLDPASEGHWTSLSLPSTVHLLFPIPISGATQLALTFQGGFAGTMASVYLAVRPKGNEGKISLGLSMGGKIYPEDKNKRQVFRIPYPPGSTPNIGSRSSALNAVNGPEPHIITVTRGSEAEEDDVPDLVELKIEFEKSSDQYGRVTVYSVEVLA